MNSSNYKIFEQCNFFNSFTVNQELIIEILLILDIIYSSRENTSISQFLSSVINIIAEAILLKYNLLY